MSELEELLHLFGDDSSRLGEFEQVSADALPQDYQTLLAHNNHMTVTVEAFHGCSVNVEVLLAIKKENLYCREILLRRSSDNQVVQFGIVRLNLNALENDVSQEILAGQIPLGRVLIDHNVLREVELLELWRVRCGEQLGNYFQVGVDTQTFGRTALIHFNGIPALELLEIVAPIEK